MSLRFASGAVAIFAMAAIVVGPAWGLTITPNDDTYIDETSKDAVRDAPTLASAGILMKGQSGSRRVGLIEFTLPDVEVTEASFNMYHFRSWAAGSANNWNFQLSGKLGEFDENTMTFNISSAQSFTSGTTAIGPVLAMPGGTGTSQDVIPAQWRTVDVTEFFNLNKGQTITLVLRCTSTGANQGGTIEDREGSRTGDPANGSYIAYTPVPEPATLWGVGLAALAFARRRVR